MAKHTLRKGTSRPGKPQVRDFKSPVSLRERNAGNDSKPEDFAPSEACQLKLHKRLAGMS